jgi:hypothetical protein
VYKLIGVILRGVSPEQSEWAQNDTPINVLNSSYVQDTGRHAHSTRMNLFTNEHIIVRFR